MTDTTEAWQRVADRLSALALKLRLHAREELSEAQLRSEVGFDRVRAAVDDAMDAIQDAYEDDAVRADARDAGRAFIDALDATLEDVQRRLRSTGS